MKTKIVLLVWVLSSVITMTHYAGAAPADMSQVARWRAEMMHYGIPVFIPSTEPDLSPPAVAWAGADIVRLGIGTMTTGIVAYIPAAEPRIALAKQKAATMDMNSFGITSYLPPGEPISALLAATPSTIDMNLFGLPLFIPMKDSNVPTVARHGRVVDMNAYGITEYRPTTHSDPGLLSAIAEKSN